MTLLDVLSVPIGLANPASALLTGPFLARLIGQRRARITQGWGWAVLAAGQSVFLLFGILSGLTGFRWIQPLMIPVAALNFVVWWRSGWTQPTAAPEELTSRAEHG